MQSDVRKHLQTNLNMSFKQPGGFSTLPGGLAHCRAVVDLVMETPGSRLAVQRGPFILGSEQHRQPCLKVALGPLSALLRLSLGLKVFLHR